MLPFQHIFKLVPIYLLFGTPESKSSTRVLNSETDAFINQVLADWNSAGGIGVAVVRKDEQVLWNVETKGYGIATIDGSKVTEHTLFAIGSNSKVGRQLPVAHTCLSLLYKALQRNCYWAVNP
jgi:hypothetical protein